MSKDHEDDPRRRLLIKALAAGVFSTALPGKNAFAESWFGSRPDKLKPGQSIYRLSGTAAVNGVPATMDTHIGPNDTITTGKDSELIFVVGGHSMLVRANSHLELHGGEEKKSGIESFFINAMRLLTGKLLSVSRNQAMNIHTATATIGIRGTGVYMETDPELTYFCNCYGTTDVASNADPNDKITIVSTYHNNPQYIPAKASPGKYLRPAPFINHTDEELMVIEALVGRSPPFVFSSKDYTGLRRDY